MFNLMSNTACNNASFNAVKISDMHSSMARLYKIALDNQVKGGSALARKLGETPQTVKNWETRGLSERGARRAQEVFGVAASWLLEVADNPYAPKAREKAAKAQGVSQNVAEFSSLPNRQERFRAEAGILLDQLDPSQWDDAISFLKWKLANKEPPNNGQTLFVAR